MMECYNIHIEDLPLNNKKQEQSIPNQCLSTFLRYTSQYFLSKDQKYQDLMGCNHSQFAQMAVFQGDYENIIAKMNNQPFSGSKDAVKLKLNNQVSSQPQNTMSQQVKKTVSTLQTLQHTKLSKIFSILVSKYPNIKLLILESNIYLLTQSVFSMIAIAASTHSCKNLKEIKLNYADAYIESQATMKQAVFTLLSMGINITTV